MKKPHWVQYFYSGTFRDKHEWLSKGACTGIGFVRDDGDIDDWDEVAYVMEYGSIIEVKLAPYD